MIDMGEQDQHESEYEEVLGVVRRLIPASTNEDRRVTWLGSPRILGICRNRLGAIELFIGGGVLAPSRAVVAELVRNEMVKDSSGAFVPANVLTLERGGHMDSIAALVCHELIEAGVLDEGGRDRAFALVEPIIEMAIDRSGRSREIIAGLAGEIFVLSRLVAAQTSNAAPLVRTWAGYAPSTRDFQLGTTGLEVKTTTGATSHHHIQGTHQVDLGYPVDGAPETRLYLLSIGIRWLGHGDADGDSIASLTEEISSALDATEEARFRSQVRQYGAASSAVDGADFGASWQRPFKVTFARLYDMTDPAIQVLRDVHVADLSHVVSSSVTYRVELPAVVTEGVNPVTGVDRVIAEVLAQQVPSRSDLNYVLQDVIVEQAFGDKMEGVRSVES